MKKFRKNKKGFTLVEVVVVLVIIAILIAIAVPSVMKYIDDANEAKYLAEARAIYIATEAELTKDYADNKKIDYSIYTGADADAKEAAFIAALETATGFTSGNISEIKADDKDVTAITNLNGVENYQFKFTSPSSGTEVKVVVEKNGTAKLVK